MYTDIIKLIYVPYMYIYTKYTMEFLNFPASLIPVKLRNINYR